MIFQEWKQKKYQTGSENVICEVVNEVEDINIIL